MLNAKNNWATKVKLLNSGRDATEPNTGYEKNVPYIAHTSLKLYE